MTAESTFDAIYNLVFVSVLTVINVLRERLFDAKRTFIGSDVWAVEYLLRMSRSRSSTPDSLFDEIPEPIVAKCDTPPIPGLWVFPALMPEDQASELCSVISVRPSADPQMRLLLYSAMRTYLLAVIGIR